MDKDLKVLELYAKTGSNTIDSFNKSLDSSYSINTNFEKFETNFEWLELMEGTVMYLDNILRNPNRFIVNEEEVVNVEKARRVTVESIKHLSRNTNYIQKIEANGDVKPSKILNINKNENYNTYENRVIYTLIKNMMGFIEMRKKSLVTKSYVKNNKMSEYHGVTRVGSEAVEINVKMSSCAKSSKEASAGDGMSILERIEKLELKVSDLTRSEVYKLLSKANVAKVIPPIKKTNLILKNTNFQYAMKLWDFLQLYSYDSEKPIKSNDTISEVPYVKDMFDDLFLLNYLVVDSLDNSEKVKSTDKEEIIKKITDNMITKIVELNSDLPMSELQSIIGDKIAVVRNKKCVSLDEIQQKFNTRIQSNISKILNFEFRS